MLKIILGFLGLLFIVFVIYTFLTGNIALGIILSIIGLVISPLAIKASNGGIHITGAPDIKAYTDQNANSDFEK